MRLKWLCLILFLCNVCAATTDVEVYHYKVEALSAKDSYSQALLKKILMASKSPNEIIDFKFSTDRITQARWMAVVQKSDANHVMWTATNSEREQSLRAIRIPTDKGLLGQRVLVIRKEDQEKFSTIRNAKDLAALVAGQGVHWPDVDILQANKLPVMLGLNKENLYDMLAAKRFDYFPRGFSQIQPELKMINEHNLAIEETLMISYPEPIYFFVRKSNAELADRIERGFEIIIKNGEFDKFFMDQPSIKAAIAELKKHKRHVISLSNPYLSKETPLQRSELWLDITKL